MGESDRYSDYRRPGRRFSLGDDGNALIGLITLNIVFFVTLLVIKAIYAFMQAEKGLYELQVLPFFQLPADLGKLATRPWTVLSYMFSAVDVLGFISNMLWLWTFGYILQELTGNKKIIPVYIYGGLAGALVFVIANYSIPALKPFIPNASLLGGSAATMALATATTFLAPDYRFLRQLNGGIPIWVLTVVFILVDFAGVASVSGAFSAYTLSHLGGAAAGFLFIYLMRKGYDGSAWMNSLYNWFMTLFDPQKKEAHTSVRERVFYNSEGRKPYKKTSNVTQQRVDEILDKINQKGFHFLTDEEKNILKRAADEDLN